MIEKKKVLVLRTCAADMTSYGGFMWPKSGHVEAPDWDAKPTCGYGLHGLLWGEGDGSLLDRSIDAAWLVCEVDEPLIVDLTCTGSKKVKFPHCEVVHCGDRVSAPAYIAANGGTGRAIVSGTATAGDRGTATAGGGGMIAIQYWNGKRYKAKIARVKDADGDGELEPNTPYRLNDSHEFEAVKR